MKITTTRITVMLLGLSIFLSACENSKIKPSSNITIQDRTIGDYNGIEISTAFNVDVAFSATEEKIEIEANENLHAYIDVFKSGNNLVIKIKDNTSIQGNSTLKAHIITGNEINEISVADASLLAFNNELDTPFLDLQLSGASNFVGGIVANSIIVSLDDASKALLEGSSGELTLNATGASTFGGYSLNVGDVIGRMSDASQSSMTIISTLDLTASGASVFMYKGDPQIVNLDLKDAAQIVKVN